MSKFKVGDKVRVRTFKIRPEHWNDYGKMDKWMGKDVTISDFFPPDSYVIAEAKGENSGMGWWFSERDFIRVDQREFIVIRRDGNEVIASHKYGDEIVKTARAKCSPADEFDFGKGAALAFDRLMGREAKPEPKAPEQPKYYTGKVVCAGVTEKALKYFSPDSWVIKKYLERVGKIYSFVDGECLKLSHCEPFSGIKQIRKQFDGNLWFEVKD